LLKNFNSNVVQHEAIEERVASNHFPIAADLEIEE